MLGRLFGSAGASFASDGYPRDSVVDEAYTRSLLYPDRAIPQDGSSYPLQLGAGRVGEYDDWSGLELDGSKDFRIILAQDALGDSEEPCVLFDTHPPPQCESPPSSASRIGISQISTPGRGSFNASTFKSPTSPLFPQAHQRTFSNGPAMPSSIRNRSSTFSGSSDEYDPRHIRGMELKDDTRNILSCAFGSSAGALSGTKMHIVSAGSGANQPPVTTSSSPSTGGYPSLGYFRKREPTARASTLGISGVRPAHHERSPSASGSRPRSTDAVLITKLFSVNLPESRDLQDPPASRTGQDMDLASSPSEDPASSTPAKAKKPRAKKTPVFAIILVVHLPSSHGPVSRPLSRGGMQTPPIHSSSRSFPNVINTHVSSPKPMPFITPMDRGDPRINALVEHWDIVDRALTLLQTISSPKILRHLKQKDSFAAALVSKPSKPKEKTMQRTNQINIYLGPLALSSDPKLKEISLQVVTRIGRALKIPRVTVGQGRWGLWNDELIRTARSRGPKEQSLFLVNLLTSFLGANTSEWIKLFVPFNSRRRQSIRQKQSNPDMVTSRTIILSNDRSTARRLIFLLSSFLAGDDPVDHIGDCYRAHTSSVSLRGAILDPPSEGPTSLHRSRSPEWDSHSNSGHLQGGLLITKGVPQNQSDVRSIKSIPIPNSDLSVRKSSAATTSTVTPDPSTPVPHFSSGSGPGPESFPEDSGASARLNKIWWNANRGSESSTGSTKWGSLVSGFWSKESSASASDSTAPSASSSIRAKKETPPSTAAQLPANKNEIYLMGTAQATEPPKSLGSLVPNSLPTKLKVNAAEGVIDVDIGIPGFLSSSDDSGLGSPQTNNVRHVPSVSSFDSLKPPKQHSSCRRSSLKSRIAGFLPKFHPDYSLQAVKCGRIDLSGLRKEIRNAMLCEPHSRDSTSSDWVDVSTTVIANVQTGSIQRLRLRRKVSRLHDHVDGTCQSRPSSMEEADGTHSVHRSLTECSEHVQEESFSEEFLTEPDPLLMGAVESILARNSNRLPRSSSPAPGPPSNNMSRRSDEVSLGSQTPFGSSDFQSPPENLPHGMSGNIILRALDEVAQSVRSDLSEERERQDDAISAMGRPAPQSKRAHDNALREGIRNWFLRTEQKAI